MSEARLIRDLAQPAGDLYRCDCGCGRRGVVWWRGLLWAWVCLELRYLALGEAA